ncbi:exosome component 3'-5' exonuclease [Aspergillus arachidicola]|uniref:Exosome component 3'-5' exonuclease n=1 Tax=Aspergillus arachidicola TaxID=656916 RepID=A0A2G7G618_9EURO|nr:exosome component 3'-5' exonuclease [Aspergillus arachidicola]
MDSAADFPPFQQQLTSSLVQMTRTVGQLSAEDLSFHRTSSAELSESIDEQSGRILSLTSSLLKAATAGTDLPAPTLQDEDSIEDNWRGVVDVIDALLERADACLDEFTGVIKRLSPSQQEQSAAKATKKATSKFPTVYDYGPSKIPKPQLHFERQVDNADDSPFKPLLRTKPHAVVPLEKSVESPDRNPYETEIRAAKYPESTYAVSSPVPYQPWESTTATFVDTLEGVKEMLKELKSAKEIAIDLEHHDVHSYQGLVSLMQISTRDKDWVVDTLKPWREELQMLNEVFADPSILKVFHGSSMDIIWLQRDLGLYVVGMFDTYHAACALNYPKRSLKFLLQKFVNFEADKRYQMADWRIRPIPEGIELTPENNLIDYVSEKSKDEALQRFERSPYDAATGQGPGGWYDYLSRNPAVLSKEQFAVFKAVHQWRDAVAREEDEGVQCVFPKHVLFKVAHAMPLDLGTLFRTLSPVTPIAKDRAADLLEVIKNAKIEGADGPEWRDVYVKPTRAGRSVPATETEQGLVTPPIGEENFPTAARCEVSQFWGAVLDAREPLTPPEYSAVASAEALRLSLPLPPMPRTVSEARDKLAGSAAKPASPKPTPAPVETPEEKEENKIFTVKGLGGPRKRKSEEARSPEGDDASDVIHIGEKPSKKQRRKEKKNKSASQTPQPEEKKEEAEPFNYEAADSVLHAQPAQTGTLHKKRPFNPYKKALEAPSGVRKQKRETPGKSFTFR